MKLRHLDDLPVEDVSHNPEIKKRVFLRNGELPNLTQFAQSIFPPGSVAPAHSHPDMGEVFLVVSGTLTASIDASTRSYPAGSCLVIEAGESHELRNDGPGELVLSYFGILA